VEGIFLRVLTLTDARLRTGRAEIWTTALLCKPLPPGIVPRNVAFGSRPHVSSHWQCKSRLDSNRRELTEGRGLNKGDPILSDYGTHHAAAVKFHVEKFRRNE